MPDSAAHSLARVIAAIGPRAPGPPAKPRLNLVSDAWLDEFRGIDFPSLEEGDRERLREVLATSFVMTWVAVTELAERAGTDWLDELEFVVAAVTGETDEHSV